MAAPTEKAAETALKIRAKLAAEKNFEALEFVEIDCVTAFWRLMRDGSPRLRQALIDIVTRVPARSGAA